MPYILILIFLLFEMTLALRTWMVLEHASREAARFGATRTPSEAAIKNRAVDRSEGLLTTDQVEVTNAQGEPGSDLQVRVEYTYEARTPLLQFVAWLLGGSVADIPMSAQTHMRIEGVAYTGGP